MTAGVAYLDASALVKLILPEPQSAALATELGNWSEQLTSAISVTEVIRACRLARSVEPTADDPDRFLQQADAVLAGMAILDADVHLLRNAATVDPLLLRSLDAIHLSTALSLGNDLGALFTYDRRLGGAAASHGLTVQSPA